YFALRYKRELHRVDLWTLAAALGLALMTKGTAYLFAPLLLLATLGLRWSALPTLVTGILLLNGPHYWRNFELSGSPLGYDSAQGDGFFRWRNETFGWKQTVSNVLRNAAEQVGGRNPEWNKRVFNFVVRTHRSLGIDVNDRATTWPWTEYEPPRNSNHEANANNRWHLVLIIAAAVWIAWRKREWLVFTIALVGGFLLFCFYLKWQLYLSRMFLPLFVLSAPIVGLGLENAKPSFLSLAICLFLLNNARPYLFENWVRPWKGPHNIWNTPRD